MPNFTLCAEQYSNNQSLIDKWHYSGATPLLPYNASTQITYPGCLAVCGHGPQLYAWSEAAATITTWILPVIGGVLLQAPWQSNEIIATAKYLFRLLGSPISLLSYNLWNIHVTGKCAMLVDMAVSLKHTSPESEAEFDSIRDSFTLLVNINMYNMKPIAASRKDCETVLRIILFSTSLPLIRGGKCLNQVRHEVARRLRVARKRGVVPVLISIAWFLFAMVLSIQSAFGKLGENAVAHDLAIGLLLSWLPTIVLTSLVDRNPAAADDVREQLNDLIDLVCESLGDQSLRDEYVASLGAKDDRYALEAKVEDAALLVEDIRGEFLQSFAGQGRSRWHYGAAHPITCDIEEKFVAATGRGWLMSHDAREQLVLGKVGRGLLWFDRSELRQFAIAVVYVNGSIGGAFILSYFTPTVGLGCRSGNYMVYAIVATTLFMAEMLAWFIKSPVSDSIKERSRRLSSVMGRPITRTITGSSAGSRVAGFFGTIGRGVGAFCVMALAYAIAASTYPIKIWYSEVDWITHRSIAKYKILRLVDQVTQIKLLTWVDLAFCLFELGNSALLIHIVVAQVFGLFTTCACQASIWSSIGGYMDLTQWDFSDNPKVTFYWTTGTVLTLTLMTILMTYVVIEWCLQSHLTTADAEAARHGLRHVRRFRTGFYRLMFPLRGLFKATNSLLRMILSCSTKAADGRRTLTWSPSIQHANLTGPRQVKPNRELSEILPPDPPSKVAPLMRMTSYTMTPRASSYRSVSFSEPMDTTYSGSTMHGPFDMTDT